MKGHCAVLGLALCALGSAVSAPGDSRPGRDPAQSVDEDYGAKIRAYTTEPFFLSPLVSYLPASPTVPTPKAVLGDVAGAPGQLPYAAEVYRYMRMLEAATPRVKVYSIGTTEEGREMIAVAVASEALLGQLGENRARLARLADPRAIGMDDAEAERLLAVSFPIYYITGAIHSPETGAPTALMELAYRLAVDESPYVRDIRDRVVTLITPVVEVDGRDRQVDVYNWHLAHPKENWPPLVYWGKYVAHDNNRDAMGLTLKLSRNVLATYLDWKAQVIHDLHESVPYLYDNTVGDGPYNAWLDPILTNEWQMIGWNNVQEMTRFGMPGVFTHGDFDTWSPGYLMFMAASHNGISRLYETFGNAGADTVERTLQPDEYSRTWYRQNPPLPKVKWSQRNNNNYEQTGLLVSLHYFAENAPTFLRNFYLKSKRSIGKPGAEGPAAYVFPAGEARPGAQAELLRVLQLQGVEISRASAPFSVTVPARKKAKDGERAEAKEGEAKDKPKKPAPQTRPMPAGSYLVRMDQPYSRIADMLLDYQYWSPKDPQKAPYDDTGWTFGEVFGVEVLRVADPKVLEVPMEPVSAEVKAPGGLSGAGAVFVVNHNADEALVTLRFRFPAASFEAAEEGFEAGGRRLARGSFIVKGPSADELQRSAAELGLSVLALPSAPAVKTHPVRTPRIALVHTWLSTQDEGWWRMAFDHLKVPYAYLSTQDVAAGTDLRARYDAVVFPPVSRSPQAIVAGMPMWGNPLPWKTTPLTPNIGKNDSTEDMRPGLGYAGIQHLQDFVAVGGLLIGVMDTADLAVTYGLTPGVSVARTEKLKATGSVLKAKVVDSSSPIAYGYGETLSAYCFDGPIFNLTNMAGGRGLRRRRPEEKERPTGRGTADDPDRPQGRPYVEAPEEPPAEAWEAPRVTDEQRRNGIFLIPPDRRPRVVLRWADAADLLVSGLLDGGGEIAQHPAVVDVPAGRGHIVLFSNNPLWRGETHGSSFLVFNALLNFDSLDAGRKPN
jgi:hypothetical protein